MSKKDEFKEFAKSNPNLASFVENGQMTWQKFYELYDIYDRDEKVWDKYTKSNSESTSSSIGKINDLIKNVNMDTIKEHISTAQKALDFVQELTSKTSPGTPKKGVSPRPLNKFFED
ncbi:MAG: spore coat protein YlbD [Bacilli bacterium]